MFPSKSVIVLVAFLGAVCAESPVPNAVPANPDAKSSTVGLTALLNCMWEDDAADCLRTQSARALQEFSSSVQSKDGEVEEPTFLEVLREGSARVLELFSEEEHQEADPAENIADNEHARTAEEGRKKSKIPKLGGGKKGKKGGGMLQTFYMLKMMLGMLISTKVAVLSFLLQIKSFFLSLIFVGIAVVQFIWKLQEKRTHGATWQAYEPAQAHGHQPHVSDTYGSGWDKRSATATAAAAGILSDPLGSALNGHDQAFRAHRPL